MKLTENQANVINYLRNNGGKVSVPELAAGLDKTEKQIGGVRLGLVKKELITYEKVAGAGEDGKDLAYFLARLMKTWSGSISSRMMRMMSSLGPSIS